MQKKCNVLVSKLGPVKTLTSKVENATLQERGISA